MKTRSKRSLAALPLLCFFFLVGVLSCEETGVDEIAGSTDAAVLEGNTAGSSETMPSGLNEYVGRQIPLDVAMRWKSNYQKSGSTKLESHFFGSVILRRLLAQPDAIGLNIEYALNDQGIQQLLIIAVDKDGRTMQASDEIGYADLSTQCPPDCGTN